MSYAQASWSLGRSARGRILLFAVLAAVPACSGASGASLGSSEDAGGPGGSASEGNTGSSDGGGSPSQGGDATSSPEAEGGAPSGTSADAGPSAPHAPLPQFPYGPSPGVDGGAGPLLQAVQIVTATWDKAPTSDPLSTQLDAFGSTLAQSAWWTSVTADYCGPSAATCVGPGSAPIAHGVGDTPNPNITDSAFTATGNYSFKKFINDKTTAGDLPVPSANTLYVFYLPPGFSVVLDGAPTCGYHSLATVNVLDAGTVTIPYVVIPRCEVSGMQDLDVATVAASREIAEAATDPYLAQGEIGFYRVDPAWSVTGNEIGDYCAGLTTTESGSAVQRIWSNASAAAGHDPCVPAPSGEVYYSVAPEADVAQGITLAVGASATFSATAFADGATSAWSISAEELSTATILDVSFDKTSVANGDEVKVTVTLTGAPSATFAGKSYERFALVSKGADGASHSWPVVVYAK
jgi:hypothetical protein